MNGLRDASRRYLGIPCSSPRTASTRITSLHVRYSESSSPDRGRGGAIPRPARASGRTVQGSCRGNPPQLAGQSAGGTYATGPWSDRRPTSASPARRGCGRAGRRAWRAAARGAERGYAARARLGGLLRPRRLHRRVAGASRELRRRRAGRAGGRPRAHPGRRPVRAGERAGHGGPRLGSAVRWRHWSGQADPLPWPRPRRHERGRARQCRRGSGAARPGRRGVPGRGPRTAVLPRQLARRARPLAGLPYEAGRRAGHGDGRARRTDRRHRDRPAVPRAGPGRTPDRPVARGRRPPDRHTLHPAAGPGRPRPAEGERPGTAPGGRYGRDRRHGADLLPGGDEGTTPRRRRGAVLALPGDPRPAGRHGTTRTPLLETDPGPGRRGGGDRPAHDRLGPVPKSPLATNRDFETALGPVGVGHVLPVRGDLALVLAVAPDRPDTRLFGGATGEGDPGAVRGEGGVHAPGGVGGQLAWRAETVRGGDPQVPVGLVRLVGVGHLLAVGGEGRVVDVVAGLGDLDRRPARLARVDRVDLLTSGPVAPEPDAIPAPGGVILARVVVREQQRRTRAAERDHVDLPARADLGDDGDLLAVGGPGHPAPAGQLTGDHPGRARPVRVGHPELAGDPGEPGEGDALAGR